ncbi:MAG TPA: sugar phosphate isomerase/epimerase, partial [Acidimicrobiales bacterium]|nr:sugar phosphate isomerase/epimerase [Acidimicrobiales bacterium]
GHRRAMKAPRGGVLERLAGAPISWGVCEVPGWGIMLPPSRVLSEMHGLGLRASELGALGYLGYEPAAVRALLSAYSLGAVGGFVPLSLHDRAHRDKAARDAAAAAALLQGCGGSYFVTAVVVDEAWSAPFDPSSAQWDELVHELDMVGEICSANDLCQVVHPHVGTLIERAEHVDEVMARSGVAWCLDTGHLAIGGVDPVAFAREHAARVALVHLKDVDLSLAPAVIEHKVSLLDATRAGLFRALGRGDVDVAGVVTALEAGGYQGWYVFEQDTTLEGDAAASADPAADVRASIEYLRGFTAKLGQG